MQPDVLSSWKFTVDLLYPVHKPCEPVPYYPCVHTSATRCPPHESGTAWILSENSTPLVLWQHSYTESALVCKYTKSNNQFKKNTQKLQDSLA